MESRRDSPAPHRLAILMLGLALVPGCGVATRFASAEEAPAPLLGYCAPPFVPPCLSDLRHHPERVKTCAPEAEAYEATVFKYRICLTRETERAVREANAAMAKLRCAQRKGAC